MFTPLCFRSEQTGVLLLLGLALTLWSLRHERPFWGGVGLVLMMTKPHITGLVLIVLALWALRHRKSAVLWWGAGLTAALTLVATLAIPRWWAFDWSQYGKGAFLELNGLNIVQGVRVGAHLYDFLHYALSIPQAWTYPIALAIGMGGMMLLWTSWHRYREPVMVTTAAILVNQLLTIYLMPYDFPILAAAIFVIFATVHRLPPWARIATELGLLAMGTAPIWISWTYYGYLTPLAISLAFGAILYAPSPKGS
jgi:hypothetical protein